MRILYTRKGIALCLVMSAGLLTGFGAAGQTADNPESMGFSRVVRDPASAGLAFSGKASPANVAWASFNNAALVPMFGGKLDAELSYQGWAPSSPTKSSPISVGVAYNFGKVGVSLGGSYIGYAAYDIYDEGGNMTGSYSPTDMQINAGVGFLLGKSVSAGVNARYLSSRFSAAAEDAYSSFGVDVFVAGAVAMSGSVFNYTVGVANLGSGIKDASGKSYPLPTSVSGAVSFRAELAPKNFLRANADVDYFFSSSSVSGALGVEYSYADMLFVRGGYHYATQGCVIPSFASIGIGGKLYGVKVNAAYLLANEVIGGTLCLGIGYTF